MGYAFKHANRDANQSAIVDALVRAGCCVVDLASVGDGCPDLLVSRNGSMWLIEIKNPASVRRRAKRYGEMTDQQIEFLAAWRGPQINMAHDAEEALRVVCVTEDEVLKALAQAGGR